MGIVAAIVVGAVLLVWCLFLAALVAPAEDLEAAGVCLGPEIGSVSGDDVCAFAHFQNPNPPPSEPAPVSQNAPEKAGPEQLAYVGPLLVCIVCQRVRTRPGQWVAGGSAPFGGVEAIRRAGKAEDCVCKWCAPMVMDRAVGKAREVLGAAS